MQQRGPADTAFVLLLPSKALLTPLSSTTQTLFWLITIFTSPLDPQFYNSDLSPGVHEYVPKVKPAALLVLTVGVSAIPDFPFFTSNGLNQKAKLRDFKVWDRRARLFWGKFIEVLKSSHIGQAIVH